MCCLCSGMVWVQHVNTVTVCARLHCQLQVLTGPWHRGLHLLSPELSPHECLSIDFLASLTCLWNLVLCKNCSSVWLCVCVCACQQSDRYRLALGNKCCVVQLFLGTVEMVIRFTPLAWSLHRSATAEMNYVIIGDDTCGHVKLLGWAPHSSWSHTGGWVSLVFCLVVYFSSTTYQYFGQ